MKRSVYYIGLIILLLGANLTLLVFPRSSSHVSLAKAYFEKYDLETIESVSISNGDQVVILKKGKEQWTLNDSLNADPGFVNTLLSIFDRVEASRKLSTWDGGILGEVVIKFADQEIAIKFGSNATRTKSYFVQDEVVSQVSVPGYRNNLVDVFELHSDQWQDRLVLDGTWRTIQRLHIDYPLQEDLEIRFEDKFFTVNEQQPQDSSVLVDYLNQFEYFQANEIISRGRFPELDSLVLTTPKAELSIDDIRAKETLYIKIFPVQENENYHLISMDGKMMVIDDNRMMKILVPPAHFLSK